MAEMFKHFRAAETQSPVEYVKHDSKFKAEQLRNRKAAVLCKMCSGTVFKNHKGTKPTWTSR